MQSISGVTRVAVAMGVVMVVVAVVVVVGMIGERENETSIR